MNIKFIAVLFIVLCLNLVLGQAPGDFSETCRTNFRYRGFHDWIPYANDTAVGVRGDVKWQVIVDQYDYNNILGGGVPEGVWTASDFDGDGDQFTQSSTTCTNRLRLDTYLTSNSNNWVFTQSVSYIDAMEVVVNATVRFTACEQRSGETPPCVNSFVTLYRYDTNSSQASNEITNTANYQPCFGDQSSSHLEQSGDAETNIIRRFTRPNFASTYFGIEDIGTIGDVIRLLVYYRVAQGFEQGLVLCPNIALPPEDSQRTVSQSCTCKNNSMAMSSLEMTCDRNGDCVGSPMCGCGPGYQYNDTQNICQACPIGMFKAVVSNSVRCAPCPANSTSTSEASSVCECDCGTTRNPSRPEDPCTRPLSVGGAVAITFFVTLIATAVITALTVFLVMWFLCVKKDNTTDSYSRYTKQHSGSSMKTVESSETYKKRPPPNAPPKASQRMPPTRPIAPPRPV